MSESQIAYEAVEVLTSFPGEGRIAYMAIELVASYPVNEMTAHTVLYEESYPITNF